MNIDVKGVHWDVSDRTRKLIDKRLTKIKFAEDLIVDLLITIVREKQLYKVECNVNFRWGTPAHVQVETFYLPNGINKMFEKLKHKISKEKEKVQEH